MCHLWCEEQIFNPIHLYSLSFCHKLRTSGVLALWPRASQIGNVLFHTFTSFWNCICGYCILALKESIKYLCVVHCHDLDLWTSGCDNRQLYILRRVDSPWTNVCKHKLSSGLSCLVIFTILKLFSFQAVLQVCKAWKHRNENFELFWFVKIMSEWLVHDFHYFPWRDHHVCLSVVVHVLSIVKLDSALSHLHQLKMTQEVLHPKYYSKHRSVNIPNYLRLRHSMQLKWPLWL